MDFNKCKRCGCFYIAEGDTCPSCTTKDNNEISTLTNYFNDNENNAIHIHELSSITGISIQNLSRYASYKNLILKIKIIL
jgi:hypothetical protein